MLTKEKEFSHSKKRISLPIVLVEQERENGSGELKLIARLTARCKQLAEIYVYNAGKCRVLRSVALINQLYKTSQLRVKACSCETGFRILINFIKFLMEIENTRFWDFDIKERKVKDHCT